MGYRLARLPHYGFTVWDQVSGWVSKSAFSDARPQVTGGCLDGIQKTGPGCKLGQRTIYVNTGYKIGFTVLDLAFLDSTCTARIPWKPLQLSA